MPTLPSYMAHPIRITDLAVSSLWARLSLHENQEDFAKRFRVSYVTISNWETGKSLTCHTIHKEIMDMLLNNLQKEGHLIPREQVLVLLNAAVEKKGNADF